MPPSKASIAADFLRDSFSLCILLFPGGAWFQDWNLRLERETHRPSPILFLFYLSVLRHMLSLCLFSLVPVFSSSTVRTILSPGFTIYITLYRYPAQNMVPHTSITSPVSLICTAYWFFFPFFRKFQEMYCNCTFNFYPFTLGRKKW